VAVLAGLRGLLLGYDTRVIGGAQLFIEKDLHLSSFSDEVLVSCVLVGAIVGSLAAGAANPGELEDGMRRPCCWPGRTHRERTGS
jgi:hypothetical protein